MYRRTCLNVHPCAYDAYGMTVVEAAAFGAPSCVQRGDLVGCAALLRQSEMEFIPVDWTLNSEADLMTTESSPTDDHVADVVEGYLRAGWDGVHAGDSLRSIGERARVRAVGYDLLACGESTGEFILILVLVRAIRVTSCVFCVQDYVANFWCATSPMVKWRRLLTVSASAKLAGITTLCAMAPAVYRQIQRPSDEGFLWCMACVSTSFFLFSFQVSLFLFTYGQLE